MNSKNEMKNSIYLPKHYFYFFFFLLIINISKSSQAFLYFNYPYAFTIKDRNIFVIHQDGITICDPTLKRIIRNETVFESSEKINNDDSLSKVTTLYENGYIICLINDYIYIFDEEGNLKLKSSNTIHSGTVSGEYYTLVNIGISSNFLYYVIGFVYNQKLYFYGYKYDINANTNSKYANLNAYNHRYSSSNYYIRNKGLSCQYVTKTSLGQCLLCVYLIYYNNNTKIAFDYFTVTTSSIAQVNSSSYNQYLPYFKHDVSCFKTALSSDKKNVLIAAYNSNGIGTFASFNVNKAYTDLDYRRYIIAHYFRKIYHTLKLTYFSEKNEFLYTCLLTSNSRNNDGSDNNDLVLVEFFNNQLINYDYAWKYEISSCEMNAYSILYLEHKSAYYIISDIKCNGVNYPLQILTGVEPTEAPITEYIPQTTQYIPQTTQYIPPTTQYIPPTTQYIPPTTQYIPPTTQYIFPTTQYIPPTTQYIPPTTQFIHTTTQFIHPTTQFIPPTTENISPTTQYISPTTNYIQQTSQNIVPSTQYVELSETQKSDRAIDPCENLIKCELCDENSASQNLCISCNHNKGYYFLNVNSLNEGEQIDGYIECVNNETKPSNFYFNEENEDYRPCYEACETCDIGGDWENNNCKTCKNSYIIKPDISGTSDCVIKCEFYYYYTNANQYKCTVNEYCPPNYPLFIKEKENGKCTNNCKNEDVYKYLYDTKCLKECPNNTNIDNVSFICVDKNTNDYKLTETKHILFDVNITTDEIDNFVKFYSNNFEYTDNHISLLESNNISLMFFKYNSSDIFSYISLKIPQIDLDDCINEIKKRLLINENLIMAIEYQGDKIIYISFYDPRTNDKILYDDTCRDIPAIVEEDLTGKVKDLDTFLFLINQGIDPSDINSDFFTDLCFHYKSPIDRKDIPLRERVRLFFPNVSLCKEGCSFKGVNTATNKSICECKLSDLLDSDIIEGNKFLQSSMEHIKTLIQKTNIEVLRCYKDLFVGKFYVSNHGSFIIMGLLLIQIVLTIIYYKKYIFKMRKYLYNLTQNYLLYLASKGVNINIEDSIMKQDKKLLNYTKTLNKNNINNFEGNSDENNQNIKANKSIRNNNIIKSKRHTNVFSKNKLSFDNLLSSKNKIEKKDNISRKKSSVMSGTKLNSFEKMNSKKIKSNLDISLMITNKLDINMEEYIQTDPNDMDYDDAIRRDKRTLCSFFCDKLQGDFFTLNVFCLYEPLNPRPIKLLLFIMNVDLNFFVNGLFFTEEHLEVVFNLQNDSFLNIIDRFMDRVLYITLIDIIINYVSDFFFYEERIIKKIFKREKENILFLKYEMAQITKNIKSRYNSFIIVCFSFAIFVWYYAFCFNNIYPSMKIEWIITSIIIIFVMQAFDFLKILLETCIRFISLKCKSEKLFKFSTFLS